jgi:hypothetical protein
MPTKAQRDADRQFNEEATAALMEWQAQYWELSISEKAAFLSGYIAGVDRKRPD